MVVAVNARLWLPEQLEGIGHFTKEVTERMALNNPQHEFHLLFDRAFDQSLITSPNLHGHVVGPPARHPLLWKWWFDVRVPALLKRIGADVFFSPDGQCSLTTGVPQCLAVHDLSFLHVPQSYPGSHRWYYKRYTPDFVRKAKTVVAVSAFTKRDIVERYGTAASKITVAHNGVRPVFGPIGYGAQAAVKEAHTGGTEFFLYAGAVQPRKNLVNLLKAFSVFKKRLKSSMKLVLAGRLAWRNNEFLALLKTYKHRSDVVLTGYLPEAELSPLMASAYALVYPSLFEGFGLPVAEAMRCGVPVLTSKGSAMEEVTAGAALYFNPTEVDDIADKLMRIYKDESERAALIQKGLVVAENYTWDKTADAVWEAITAIANRQS